MRVDVQQFVGELQPHRPPVQSGRVGIGGRYGLDTVEQNNMGLTRDNKARQGGG